MLVFNEEKHEYLVDGERLPSVTEIINSFLAPFQWDMSRGRAVHKACQYYDEGDLDEDTLDVEVIPYFEGYKKFKSEHEIIWEAIEKPVYHRVFRYAGTPDRWGMIDGTRTLLDLKSGSVPPFAKYQLAGYADMLDYNLERRVLFLLPYRYKLMLPFTDHRDIQGFRSMITVFNILKTMR